jgi:hypothetical protein
MLDNGRYVNFLMWMGPDGPALRPFRAALRC